MDHPRLLFFLSLILSYTEDEKVSTDELQEQIQEFEDYVQSTDIAAMQSAFRVLLFEADRPLTLFSQNSKAISGLINVLYLLLRDEC